MKKSTKIILIIVAIAILIILALVINRKTDNKQSSKYEISILNDKYEIDKNSCTDLTEDEILEIASKIFCANHNIERTFKNVSELEQKDFILTVWFEKYRIENKKTCSQQEFEQILKQIYNTNYSNHNSLENVVEYSNGKYKFLDLQYENYQIPVIENVAKTGANTYEITYTITNIIVVTSSN